jgi:hypothetical protein
MWLETRLKHAARIITPNIHHPNEAETFTAHRLSAVMFKLIFNKPWVLKWELIGVFM